MTNTTTTVQKVGLVIGGIIAGAAIYCGVTKCLKNKMSLGRPRKGDATLDVAENAKEEAAPTVNNADGASRVMGRGAGSEVGGMYARKIPRSKQTYTNSKGEVFYVR